MKNIFEETSKELDELMELGSIVIKNIKEKTIKKGSK